MASVADSPRRLFGLIVLALFFPYVAMGIEFGRSNEFAISFVTGLLLPMSLFATTIVPMIIIGHILTFASVLYSVYQLCCRRYTPVSQDEESTVSGTPEVGETAPASAIVADPSIAKF